MSDVWVFCMASVVVGAGATAVLDLWNGALKRFFGIPSLNLALLGRWIGHLPRGRFVHPAIAAAAPVRGERLIGWCAHYSIGITFAAVLLTIQGVEWARDPILMPALVVGIGTVAAPFLILQPGMGLGIAGSRAPRPAAVRWKSLASHTIYGFGLYLVALLTRYLF